MTKNKSGDWSRPMPNPKTDCYLCVNLWKASLANVVQYTLGFEFLHKTFDQLWIFRIHENSWRIGSVHVDRIGRFHVDQESMFLSNKNFEIKKLIVWKESPNCLFTKKLRDADQPNLSSRNRKYSEMTVCTNKVK